MNAASGTGSTVPFRVLVMFAVREEAKHFEPPPGIECKVVISGIGKQNAERALTAALESFQPQLVLTCGFAGGLNPDLPHGSVVSETDRDCALYSPLNQVALPITFFCSDRIAVTAEDKRLLRQQTGADAVEMESGVIRAKCRQRGIPAATVRVISDDASTDLPMDFNQLAGADGNMNYMKLAGALAKSPSLVPRLMRFRRELEECSRRLDATLQELLVLGSD